MGIISWFINDFTTEERNLTRDLISVAISDHEFVKEEFDTILEICRKENISDVEVMESLRRPTSSSGAKLLRTFEEKKTYLLYLIEVMSSDGHYPAIEIQIFMVIAKKIGFNTLQVLSVILDEVKAGGVEVNKGIAIMDHIVKHSVRIGE